MGDHQHPCEALLPSPMIAFTHTQKTSSPLLLKTSCELKEIFKEELVPFLGQASDFPHSQCPAVVVDGVSTVNNL